MTENDPHIDLTQISFPSDQLTIQMLRKNYPGSFDREAVLPENRKQFLGRTSIENAIGGTIDFERHLAVLEFKRVLGLPLTKEEGQFKRDNLAKNLIEEYVHLGLAAGENHGEQLIRDVESQASAQARGFLPDPPPH